MQKLKNIEAKFSKQLDVGPNVHEVVGSAVNKGL